MLKDKKTLLLVALVVIVGLGIGLASVLGPEATAQGATYVLDEDWPMYPPDMVFQMGSGITVDDDGTIYTYTRDVDHWASHPLVMEASENGTLAELTQYRGVGSVQMYDRTGKHLGQWAPDEPLIGAHSLYFHEGFFWVVDRDGHQVKKMTKDGALVMALGELGVAGGVDSQDHFNGPTGLAFRPDGGIVVSDGYWNSRLVWFDKDGNFEKQVGEWGAGPGQFGTVHAVTLDAQQRLLVVNLCGGTLHPYVLYPDQLHEQRYTRLENCESRVDMLDLDGNYLGRWPVVKSPLTVFTSGDLIFASEAGDQRGRQNLLIVNAMTDEITDVITNANVYVHQAAVDPTSGDIYVGSVYPEHGGYERGIAGPSNRRWVKQ